MKRLINCALTLALALAAALPVLAGDNFTKGVEFYNSGQYVKALPYFQDTVSKKPRDWHGHYYLAHTYLSLGQKSAALEQYQICQTCKPTPEVAAACQTVASRIAATASGGGMPDYGAISPTHQKYVNAQRQVLMDEACRESKKMVDGTMTTITNGNQVVSGTGSMNINAPKEDRARAQQLIEDSDGKGKALLEETRIKMRNMK